MKLNYYFNGEEFELEIDNEDIKWDLINLICKELEIDNINRIDVVDIIEKLDVWDYVLNKNIDKIKKLHEWEALENYENKI